jgi:hypothetical protein
MYDGSPVMARGPLKFFHARLVFAATRLPSLFLPASTSKSLFETRARERELAIARHKRGGGGRRSSQEEDEEASPPRAPYQPPELIAVYAAGKTRACPQSVSPPLDNCST